MNEFCKDSGEKPAEKCEQSDALILHYDALSR